LTIGIPDSSHDHRPEKREIISREYIGRSGSTDRLEQRAINPAIAESPALDILEYRSQLRRPLLEWKRVVAIIVSYRLDLVVQVTKHEALVLCGTYENDT